MWTKGTDALEGELQSSSEVDFYIDQVNSPTEFVIILVLFLSDASADSRNPLPCHGMGLTL